MIVFFRYALSHIDFHFGSDNSRGSEHSINGAQSPMEMEVVFYDGTFKSTSEVQYSENQDAIVAITFLFEVNVHNMLIRQIQILLLDSLCGQ